MQTWSHWPLRAATTFHCTHPALRIRGGHETEGLQSTNWILEMEGNTHILPGDTNQIIPQNKQRLLVFKFSAQLKTHHFRIINFLPQYLLECPRRGKIWRQNCFWRWGNKQFFCDGFFNGVFTDWGHFHLIWLLSRDGWHWLWRHPQWWLGSGSFQDQTASCYLKTTAIRAKYSRDPRLISNTRVIMSSRFSWW